MKRLGDAMPAGPITLPRWLGTLICTTIAGGASVLYADHDANIAMRSELTHVQKILDETRKEQAKLRGDLDNMRAENSDFHEKALAGINELVERGNRRGGRR